MKQLLTYTADGLLHVPSAVDERTADCGAALGRNTTWREAPTCEGCKAVAAQEVEERRSMHAGW